MNTHDKMLDIRNNSMWILIKIIMSPNRRGNHIVLVQINVHVHVRVASFPDIIF